MTHCEHVKDLKIRREARESKRTRTDGGGSSNFKPSHGGNGKFKKGNKRHDKGKGIAPPAPKDNVAPKPYPQCNKCGRYHPGECLAG